MTREEIIFQLKEMRKKGYTYKGIAEDAGLDNADQIYKFINRPSPAYWVAQKLEAYLRKVNGNDSSRGV